MSHPPALAAARFKTVVYARLECVSVLSGCSIQQVIAVYRGREKMKENVFIHSAAHTAYFGALSYIATAPSIRCIGNGATYIAVWWL